jgi:hypothetical protein
VKSFAINNDSAYPKKRKACSQPIARHKTPHTIISVATGARPSESKELDDQRKTEEMEDQEEDETIERRENKAKLRTQGP